MSHISNDKKEVQVMDEPSHVENAPKPSHVKEIGSFRVVGLSDEDAEFYTNFPEKERKKAFRKVGLGLQASHSIANFFVLLG